MRAFNRLLMPVLLLASSQLFAENAASVISIPDYLPPGQVKPVPVAEQQKTAEVAQAALTACSTIARQMYLAGQNRDVMMNDYQWKNMSWIDKTLGPAWKQTDKLKVYTWGEYQIATKNDQVESASGVAPDILKDQPNIPSIESAIQLLGKPQHVEAVERVTYSWRCPDSRSDIDVKVSDNGLTRYSGQYCMAGDCRPFSVDDIKSNHAFSNYNDDLSQTIKLFKSWFSMDLKTEDEVTKTATQLTKNYFSKLRLCAPGVYKFPVYNTAVAAKVNQDAQPLYYLATATILGERFDKCYVNRVTQSGDKIDVMKCAFSRESLDFFSDGQAQKIATQAMSFNHAEDERILQIQKECEAVEQVG